jgi:hypothetical protein
MKKLLLIMISSISIYGFSQESSKLKDEQRIAIATYVPKQIVNMPEEAKSVLLNKLNQIITNNGIGGQSNKERFVMTANIALLTKDIVPTAPPMHAYTLEVTLYIGDAVSGMKFSSISRKLKGTGETETRAYLSALKNLKTTDESFHAFIDDAKKKIVSYYSTQCDFIIKEAQGLESRQEYGQAIYLLNSVPTVCSTCFDKCQTLLGPIYKKYIDLECKKLLLEANNVWAANQNFEGAEKVAAILTRIDPSSVCFNNAIALNDKIAKRVLELDNRQWNFTLKIQQNEVDLEKARIKAIRDIGVAYGNNQPDIVYETVVYGWW